METADIIHLTDTLKTGNRRLLKLSRPERTADEVWTVMRVWMDPHRQSVHQLCITFSISTEGSKGDSCPGCDLAACKQLSHSRPMKEEHQLERPSHEAG